MEDRKSFKSLKIWQKADLMFRMACVDVGEWPYTPIAKTISQQLLNAIGSMSANIAEGYGRGSPREFERFLLICRGSMSESDNWLLKAKDQRLITENRYREYLSLFEEISKMTGSFINKLRKQPKRKI